MFVKLHIDLVPAEGYAFRLQAETLLESVVSCQLDHAASTQNAMPRDSVGAV